MYVTTVNTPSRDKKKIYQSILLRRSYRDEDGRVRNQTIANLSSCPKEDIHAIQLAIQHSGNLAKLISLEKDVTLEQGPSIGAVWVLYEVAKKLGIVQALGSSHSGKLALWQILARIINQGSRLSAVRLAESSASIETLGIKKSFNEDDLYTNLAWLSEKQDSIEDRLFAKKEEKPTLFLYDVTSTYLEGDKNELAAFGYNRDKKKGKKQLVVGLLCDATGDPVSVQVFVGNTSDTTTFADQVKKAAERFSCKDVVFVGDKGMIKSAQMKDITTHGFSYITSITKKQIQTLIQQDIIQLGLFDENVIEVQESGTRYILRRNPVRMQDMRDTRDDKERYIQEHINKANKYLAEHPQAHPKIQQRDINEKIARVRLSAYLSASIQERTVVLKENTDSKKEISLLDGCYVITTNVQKSVTDTQTIHDRYRGLQHVEYAFRIMKTSHLELRPVYVRKEESTRAHVLIVMLAYKITHFLSQEWKDMDITVSEGIRQLSELCATRIQVGDTASCLHIPKGRPKVQKLLSRLDISLPGTLPARSVHVVSKKKVGKRSE